MAINSNHMVGFVAGIATATVGFYLYKKNQSQVDAWLRQQGINLPAPAAIDPAALTLEELVTEKERLEDVIAEREMAADPTPEPE